MRLARRTVVAWSTRARMPPPGGGSSATSAAVMVSVTARSAMRADLGRVDEALAALGVDDDPVEDVLAPGLLGTAHGAHLDAVGRAHRRPALEHLEGDRVAVVLCHGQSIMVRPR